MKARLYCPAQRTTQSGKRPQQWTLEIEPEQLYKEPVMGWTTSKVVALRLAFPSKERALTYVREHSLSCKIIEKKSPSFQQKSYADNFHHDRLH